MALLNTNLSMIGIPLKKTEQISFTEPMETFIKNSFGEEVLKSQRDALQDLQQIREDIRITQDKSDATTNLYKKYLGFLTSIALRFPVSESNVRLNFTWYEAFKNAKKQSRYSIYYERASVLFNLGAHYSQLGQQNRSTEEGMKRAANSYQLAAGCFSQTKDLLQRYPQDAALVDLTLDSLNALSNLMLAQAQECFFEKAFKGNMQPVILAKLAAQAADYYDTASSLFNLPSLKSNIDKNWPIVTQARGQYFNSIAHYHVALAAHKEDQYGKEVAYYSKAVYYINEAKKNIKSLPQDFQEAINKYHATVLKAFQGAEADNNRIYHEQVPKDTPPIEKKTLVKAVPLEDYVLTEDTDPFYKLVPFAMLQAISIYGEMKASLVRNELTKIEEYNGIAKSSLFSTGLPGSIQAFESPTGIPQTLSDKIHMLQSKGGIARLYDLSDNLATAAKEVETVLNVGLDSLNAEETEDNTLRSTYGDKWARTPSHTLTSGLRQDALKYQGNLEHARKSDSYIRKKLSDNEKLITLLSGTHEEILAFLPANLEADASHSEIVVELKNAMRQLDDLIEVRGNLQNELKKISEKDDITSKLFGTTEPQEAIFARELKKYEPIQARIASHLADQEKVLSRISALNDQFVLIKQSNKLSLEREAALQKLDLAFKNFYELEGNFKEGIQFYKNFQDLLVKFKVTIDDFVFARNTEKNELQSQIQNQAQQAHQKAQQAQAQAQLQAQMPTHQQSSLLQSVQPQLFPQMASPHMFQSPIMIDPSMASMGGAPVGWQMQTPTGLQPVFQQPGAPQYYIVAPQTTPGGTPQSGGSGAPPPYPGAHFFTRQ